MNKEQEKEFVILASILDLGGSASKQVVLDHIEFKQYINFSQEDLETCETRNELRWRNDLAWTRSSLVGRDYVDNFTKNTWRITKEGERYLEELCHFLIEAQQKVKFKKLTDEAIERAKKIVQLCEDELESDQNQLREDNLLSPNSTEKTRKITGKELNQRWGVNAEYALYSFDGTWYHRLTRFPGALFDQNGYVLFKTEAEYLECSYILISEKHTTCSKGIASIPSYVRVENTVNRASDLTEPTNPERVVCVTKRIIRDTQLAQKVKQWYKNKCQLCNTILKLFGGESYAEAHHIKPLGSDHNGPDVAENIVCVCPNCHAQLDYGAILLNKTTLQVVPQHHIKDEYINYHNSKIYKG